MSTKCSIEDTRARNSEESKAMDTQGKSTKLPRRDLVRSYGLAIITIGEKTYTKIEEQNGTTGWLARKFAFIIFPIIWWIKFIWLSHLSFIDKQIQTVEWILSHIFPSSERLFSNIDELASFADSLPNKLEDVINALGVFIGMFPYFPFFDWVIEVLEEILNIMLNIIPSFGLSNANNSRENDTNYANEGDGYDMIAREAIKEKVKEVANDWNGEKKKGGKNKMDVKKDVLELFDSAWHLKNV